MSGFNLESILPKQTKAQAKLCRFGRGESPAWQRLRRRCCGGRWRGGWDRSERDGSAEEGLRVPAAPRSCRQTCPPQTAPHPLQTAPRPAPRGRPGSGDGRTPSIPRRGVRQSHARGPPETTERVIPTREMKEESESTTSPENTKFQAALAKPSRDFCLCQRCVTPWSPSQSTPRSREDKQAPCMERC